MSVGFHFISCFQDFVKETMEKRIVFIVLFTKSWKQETKYKYGGTLVIKIENKNVFWGQTGP